MGDYLSWHAPAPGSSKEFKKARSLKKGGSKGGRPRACGRNAAATSAQRARGGTQSVELLQGRLA